MTIEPSVVPTVHHAITEVKRAIGAVPKTDTNPDLGYRYRGIDAVVDAVSAALIQHAVTVVPIATHYQYDQLQVGRNSARVGHVLVTVTYRWTGPGGDYTDVTVVGEAMDAGDKAAPKAMSVAWRTCLLQTLTLPTGAPDPDAESFDRNGNEIDDLSRRLEWIRQAVIDQDIERLRSIYRNTPRSMMGVIADPSTGRDLSTYLEDAAARIVNPDASTPAPAPVPALGPAPVMQDGCDCDQAEVHRSGYHDDGHLPDCPMMSRIAEGVGV